MHKRRKSPHFVGARGQERVCKDWNEKSKKKMCFVSRFTEYVLEGWV